MFPEVRTKATGVWALSQECLAAQRAGARPNAINHLDNKRCSSFQLVFTEIMIYRRLRPASASSGARVDRTTVENCITSRYLYCFDCLCNE